MREGQSRMIVSVVTLACAAMACEKPVPKASDIEGDWMLAEETSIGMGMAIGTSFQRDTAYLIRDGWYEVLAPYKQKGDTVAFDAMTDDRGYWIIRQATADTLKLVQDGRTRVYYSRNLEEVDSLELEKIQLNASSCFGHCPQFKWSYASTGHVEFQPINFCLVDSSTHYQLDDSTQLALTRAFKKSWIHHLDTNRTFYDVDGWALQYNFHFNGKTRVTFGATEFNIPFRIKPIHGIIMRDLRKRKLI